jgi:hypothetical protein
MQRVVEGYASAIAVEAVQDAAAGWGEVGYGEADGITGIC